MLLSSMSPILTLSGNNANSNNVGEVLSVSQTWGLEGSEDTGWVTLETLGASPTNNQPGYANWELNFAPGAIVSNVSLEVGVDGSNGIYAMNPELYSPNTQYSFFDWSANGGFGYQEGFINGEIHNDRMQPLNDLGAMYKIPSDAEITDLILEALSPVDPAVSLSPIDLTITDWEIDPNDGRLYIAINDFVLQIDDTVEPKIIHLREIEENAQITDLFIDEIGQNLMITYGGKINVYSLGNGALVAELPVEPIIAGEAAQGFLHSFASANDIYGVSERGLFRLNSLGNSWNMEQISGNSEWPEGVPTDIESVNGIVYVSIENGGIARWDTSSNSVFDLLEGSSNNVHEMVVSGDIIYIATRDNGVLRWNYAQNSWISAWTGANWLSDNNVVDLITLDNYIFILLENNLHQHDTSIGVMTNEYNIRTDLNMARDGVNLIPWPSNGARSPSTSIALLNDGRGVMSVLDPMISGLYSHKMDLVSSPSGTSMDSVIQMGSKVFVSSGNIIDVFDSSAWKWVDPITNLGGDIAAMTTDGTFMYVATEDSSSILELDSMGNLTRLWGSTDLTDEVILDISYDDSGYLVVSHPTGITIVNLVTNDAENYEYDIGPYTDLVTVDGIAYLGTFNNGVQRIEIDTGTQLSPWRSTGLDELENVPVAVGNGMIYLGIPDYGVTIFDEMTGEILEVWTGGQGGDLPSDTILSLHIDMDGYVWIGTEEGATRFNGQRFNDLDHDGQWWSHRYYDFDSDSSYVWAAMAGNEICRWNRQTLNGGDDQNCWDEDAGLPTDGPTGWNDYVSVRFIATNQLMVTTYNGAALFDTNALTVLEDWSTESSSSNSAVVQHNGIVYLGLEGEGILRYDTSTNSWMPSWNLANNMIPNNQVTALVIDESRTTLWVGGEDDFDLTQIDLSTGTVLDGVDFGTEGLEEIAPQKLIIDSDVLYFIPVLSTDGDNIGRIDLQTGNLGYIEVTNGSIDPSIEFGEDIFIHGADVVQGVLHIGASEAETRWWADYDEGYIMRYNLTSDGWDSPLEPGQEIGRVNSVYIGNRLYITYGDSVKELDSGGNVLNNWPNLLDGPIREIIEYNGEILFATESGIARYDPFITITTPSGTTVGDWLDTWTIDNGGLHPDSNDDEVILELYVEGTNLWYSSGTTGGQWWSSSPTLQRITGNDNNGDGLLDGNDHDIWETANTPEIPNGDIWSMEECNGNMHFAVRWQGQFGNGGGVGRYNISTDSWESNVWTQGGGGLDDDDAVALTCDDQNVVYIGYQDEGRGISRYDYTSSNWLTTLDSSDGISEDSVWWDSLSWGGGILVIGHSFEDDSDGGISIIEVSGNLVFSGLTLDQNVESSSVNYVNNAPFGSGFIIGRPGGSQGFSSVDWLDSNNQLNKAYFDSQSDFLNGNIEEFAGNSNNLYIVTANDRFDDIGSSILEGQYGANGTVTWNRGWSFGFDTIKDILFEDTSNTIWITTQGQGLWKLDLNNNSFSRISASLSPEMDGLSLENNLLAIGLTAAGANVPGVNVLDINTLQWDSGELLPGLPSNYVLDAIKYQGKTWFATVNGVGIWNDSTSQWEESLSVANGLPSPIIEKFYIHSSGEIWMATPVGVVRYDPVNESYMPTIDRLDGLVGNRVNDFVEDNGKLFISHNGAGPTRPGASAFNLTTNTVDLIYKLDQIPSNTITALSADSWGIHIATDQEPIVHYNIADNQFEDGASTWQIGNWPAIEMVSDGNDLFVLLDGDLARIDAQGVTHSVRNTWLLDDDEGEHLDLSEISLGPNGLFVVGEDGMYGWKLPNYAPMDQLIVRYADPLSISIAELNLDITDQTHPGHQLILASSGLSPIPIGEFWTLGFDENTMLYSDLPIVLSSTVENSPTWIRSNDLKYRGEWDLSDTNPEIGAELQKVLDLATMTVNGMDIELRLKTTLNGSINVRLTYDWERIQSPVEIINLEDREDDGGGVLTAEWSASPDPDFSSYSLYILSDNDASNVEDYLSTNPEPDATSSAWGVTKIDVATSGGSNSGDFLVDGEEYYGVITVTYADGSVGDPSNLFGPVFTDDDVPAPPISGYAEPNDDVSAEDGELFVEWARCRALDISHTRIHIYSQAVTNAVASTEYIDIDDDIGNSTVLELDAGNAYWLALTCVDDAGQEDLLNALIIGPVIPTGGINDGVPPPKILGVNAFDTPDDEGGRITIEWVPSIAEDCGLTTIYALDAEDWLGWDIDPSTGQNIVVEEPVTATTFRVASILTDCSRDNAIISSINGASLIDGKIYYFAVVASDTWLNEDLLNVDIVSAEPYKQLDVGALPPERVGYLESWDEPNDDGTAIRVAWGPTQADDFAYYVIWANNQQINNLEELWNNLGDDEMNCGCTRFDQQFIGSPDEIIEIQISKARYGENSNLLDENAKQDDIKANELLFVTVTVHDVKGNVWLDELLEVDVIPINNLDDKVPPTKISDLNAIDWPEDDGTAIGIEFEKNSESDVEQYAIYASTESFSSVGFGGPLDPVLFTGRSPDLPLKIDSLSDGTSIIADMEVYVSVIPIDSAGNSITEGLVVSSAISKDNRGDDPGAYLPDVENVRANWILDGNAIQIEWDTVSNSELTHLEIYASNEKWENTDDAWLIAEVEIVDGIYIMNAFEGNELNKFSDWYIGISAADEVTHRHLVQVNHVNPYGTGADGSGEGNSANFLQNLGTEIMISLALLLAILVVVVLIVRGRKSKGENWQFEGTWGIQKEQESQLWNNNAVTSEQPAQQQPVQQQPVQQQPVQQQPVQQQPVQQQQQYSQQPVQQQNVNQLVSELNEQKSSSNVDTSFLDELL